MHQRLTITRLYGNLVVGYYLRVNRLLAVIVVERSVHPCRRLPMWPVAQQAHWATT